MSDNNELVSQALDYQESDVDQREQRFGARILSHAHFESSHRPIVESSFNKALKRGEKLPGNNAERRNFAYLNRIEALISQYGNRAEKRLWRMSANDEDLLIQPQNFRDSDWRAVIQAAYDQGHGNHYFSEQDRVRYIENARDNQRESLKLWSDYLGSENSPYPLWFKVYVWDGVTKMSSVLDNKVYKKRTKSTTAPYPKLNPAALARVYESVISFYGVDDNDEKHIEDIEELVRIGNFRKLYSRCLEKSKINVEVPDDPEQIRGAWKEYTPNQYKAVAEAAEGTPWCIAAPIVAKNYLLFGGYNDKDIDEDESILFQNSRCRFFLFHLREPSTGRLSDTACASIRLGVDGEVAEISGLLDGSAQRLNDSLIPTVCKKVISLPGGKIYLPAYEDNKKLTKLDHKYREGEEIIPSDILFLYEADSNIHSLGNGRDPRIQKLRAAFPFSEYVSRLSGLSHKQAARISRVLSPVELVENVNFFNEYDVKLDKAKIMDSLLFAYFSKNFDSVVDFAGEDCSDRITSFIHRLERNPRMINWSILESYLEHGLNFRKCLDSDVDAFIPDLTNNLGVILAHKKEIGEETIGTILAMIGSENILEKWDILKEYGIKLNPNQVVRSLRSEDYCDVGKLLDLVVSDGLDPRLVGAKIGPDGILEHLKEFDEHNIKINIAPLILIASPDVILHHLDDFRSRGIDINVNQLLSRITDVKTVSDNLEALFSLGAKIDFARFEEEADPIVIFKNLDLLIAHGADFDLDDLVSRVGAEALPYAKSLIAYGAKIDVNELVDDVKSGSRGVSVYDLGDVLDSGVDGIDYNKFYLRLIGSSEGGEIILDHYNDFNQHDVDVDLALIASNNPLGFLEWYENSEEFVKKGVEQYLGQVFDSCSAEIKLSYYELFKKHGMNIDIRQLTDELYEDEELDYYFIDLLELGENPEYIKSKLRTYEDRRRVDRYVQTLPALQN